MAFQASRAKRIVEDLELTSQDGTVLQTLHVEIDVDAIAQTFNAQYNAVIRAEYEVKKLQANGMDTTAFESGEPVHMTEAQAEQAGAALQAYGDAAIALFGLIFGEENTQALIRFYENRYFEMVTEVYPFITGVIVPSVQAAVAEKREKLAKQYKASQAVKFGLNRAQRRNMGL